MKVFLNILRFSGRKRTLAFAGDGPSAREVGKCRKTKTKEITIDEDENDKQENDDGEDYQVMYHEWGETKSGRKPKPKMKKPVFSPLLDSNKENKKSTIKKNKPIHPGQVTPNDIPALVANNPDLNSMQPGNYVVIASPAPGNPEEHIFHVYKVSQPTPDGGTSTPITSADISASLGPPLYQSPLGVDLSFQTPPSCGQSLVSSEILQQPQLTPQYARSISPMPSTSTFQTQTSSALPLESVSATPINLSVKQNVKEESYLPAMDQYCSTTTCESSNTHQVSIGVDAMDNEPTLTEQEAMDTQALEAIAPNELDKLEFDAQNFECLIIDTNTEIQEEVS